MLVMISSKKPQKSNSNHSPILTLNFFLTTLATELVR
jgi:hypothetical protein